MTELRLETLCLPAANLGSENPLPPLEKLREGSGLKVDESVPAEAAKYLGHGLDARILPYRMQDGYDRQRQERELQVAVLENEILRATFLLEYGGRLWSLVHKPQERELLYRNPVFQPANLALRNAWFSGGVEWNVGLRGHTPLTCSPLFVARTLTDDGTPTLRMYEWERVRGVPYQLDFMLPPGSPWLYVRVRLTNPHVTEIPNYWWSNIAVPETPTTRVLVPAEAAFTHGYKGGMARVAIPEVDGRDITYPVNNPGARDFFFDIPVGQRRWVTALDKEGSGLVQVSTQKQRGRKLFVWGMSPGGRRWQEFLSVPNKPYIEIQAGVARTQYECFPMQPGEELTWLEAYGLMEAQPKLVHGKDWTTAWQEVDNRLATLLPEAALEAELIRTGALANQAPAEILQLGSGWGALEQKRRQQAGEPPSANQALAFPEVSLTEEQAPWLALLEQGALPEPEPTCVPVSWLVQPEWHRLLDKAVQEGRSNHWYSWLHLGVMRYQAGDWSSAKEAWQCSLQQRPSAWALRNLAILAHFEGDDAQAAELYSQAFAMAPEIIALAVECIRSLITAGRAGEVFTTLAHAPANVRNHGRVQVLTAKAALDMGELDRAEAILLSGVEVPDLREGELMLSELWYAIQEQRVAQAEHIPIDAALKQRIRQEFTPPQQIDFRMAGS